MEKRTNELIEKHEAPPQAEPKIKKQRSLFGKFFLEVLGGDFLAYSWVRKQTSFVFFLAAIALVYIGNSYYTEGMSRKIDDLNRELKELHYEYISTKSDLMQQTKQSEIAKKLKNSGLKESTEPVKKLIIKTEDYD